VAYSIVNSGSSSAAWSTTISLSLTISAAASGNVLILGIFGPTSSPVPSPSCTNVTWTLVTSQLSNFATGFTMYIWYGVVSGGSSGTTITATITGGSSGNSGSIVYTEISGIATSSPVDVSASNAQASSTATVITVTTSSITTTNSNDIVIAYLTDCFNGPPVSPSSSYTNSFTNILTSAVSASVVLGVGLAYLVPGATGTYSTAENFLSSAGIPQYGQSIIVAFLPNTGGDGGGGNINPNIIVGRRRIITSMT
jgi:hypothetical protein